MVKEELDKLVIKLRRQFPVYKGLRVCTGVETVEKGSAGPTYKYDRFLIAFDLQPAAAPDANMV
jgi:hypothetical protein